MLTSTVATLYDNSAHGEDNYLIRDLGDNALLDAVMDGVTDRKGAEASQTAADALAAATLTSPDDVVAVLNEVNEDLYLLGWGRFLMTTIAVALYRDTQISLLGAGDSPILLIRPDSCEKLVGRASGFVHAGITRVLGARETLTRLYRAEVTIEPGDRLVLATDGVTDNVTVDELADIVRRATSPDEAAEQVNTLIVNRHEQGWLPAELGSRFRRDDRTAIFRFFSATG